MEKFRKITIILMAGLLAACGQTVKTFNPTAIIVSQTTPSATPLPTATPTILPPTATLIPTRIPPTPGPTLSPLDIAGMVINELTIGETDANSPNGFCGWKRILAWPASETASLKYGNQFFTYVTISCGNREKPWILVDKWAEAGLGYSLPDLLGWSADGKYAYYYDSIIPDGCQPPGGFQKDLRQVDLTNGEISPIRITWTGGMVLSPDTTKVIYYDHQKTEVGVYDLVANVEYRFPIELPKSIDQWFAGNFTWSPNGQSAVFIIQYGDPCFPTGVSVRRVDLPTELVRILLEKKDQAVSIVGWTELDEVSISLGGEIWWLNPVSGDLSKP